MANKILLIEYEPRYLDRIRGHLAGRDFELVVAKDGEEGLESYRRSRPDLVLISSVLPKLRTPDVIKGMQALGPTPPILLMMSGYKGKSKRADAQRVGASSILEKPFSEEVFLGEIEAALGNRPFVDANAGGPFTETSSGSSLLSSDDIFSDVLSGMEDAPRPPTSVAPPAGTDPGIQKKLEQTLSGILPAPRKGGTTGSYAKPETPAPKPAAPAVPAAPAAGEEKTMRLEALNFAALQKPPAPEPPPPPPSRPSGPLKVDQSVEKMLTDTLSGLKAARTSSGSGHLPVQRREEPPAPSISAEKQKTERLMRTSVPTPVPAPEPKPPARAPEPVREVAWNLPPREKTPPPPPPPAPAPRPRPEEKVAERRRDATGTGMVAPGGTFGRYQLLEKIAAGGMAEVFKARMRGEEGFEKIVAIKRILPHMADNDDFITMFIDEAKLAAQLTHNNIIHIYDLGKVDAYHYIAMEYVEGRDLRTILKMGQERGYPLPVELALLIASKVANALDYAHRRVGLDGKELSLVHRDVSPQNILISFEGDIKLCDFGIAKATTKVSQTQTGALKGKLQYMSPEQAWGKKIDRRTDIFSLGIVLYEMLVGERLFTGDTDLTILEQVRDARITIPSTKNPDVPKKVDQIVLKALAKNAQERHQNASELEREINAVLYSFQPTPGPADLAIYMHRLSESQMAVSDEQIDAAFAKAEADGGAYQPEPQKKGKGLVISKKTAVERTAPRIEPEPRPAPPPTEVSAPALSVGGGESEKSRVGLYVGIGVAVAALAAGGIWMAKGGGSAKPTPVPTLGPTATPITVSAPSAVPTGVAPVIDTQALAQAVSAAKTKTAIAAAPSPAATTKPGAPTAVPPPVATAISLAPKGTAAPPTQPTPVPQAPTPAPRPTEPPKPIDTPKPVEQPTQPVQQPAATVERGTLVGAEEGVTEPKLLKYGSFTLPPQAKQLVKTKQTPVIFALITEDGVATEARVLQKTPYPFIDEAALNAIKGGKFSPPLKKGVQVRMWKAFSVPIQP